MEVEEVEVVGEEEEEVVDEEEEAVVSTLKMRPLSLHYCKTFDPILYTAVSYRSNAVNT
jgi:hypothetical protein